MLRSLWEVTDLALTNGSKVMSKGVAGGRRCGSVGLARQHSICMAPSVQIHSQSGEPMSATHQHTLLRTVSSAQRVPTVTEIQSSIQDHIDSSGVVKTKKFVVTAEELEQLIERGPHGVKLVDVREPREVEETGLLPRAVNIPLTSLKAALQLQPEMFELEFGISKPTRDDPVPLVFYARSAVKSTTALEIAYKLGLKKSRHFPGGWEEWSTRHQPGL